VFGAVRPLFWLVAAFGLAGCGGGAGEDSGSGTPPSWSSDVALSPPLPGEGFQLHFGPDDLDDPESVSPFVLPPGAENVACGYARSPNEADAYFAGYELIQREGAHHFLLSGATADAPEGNVFDCAFEGGNELFLNVQGARGPGVTRFVHPEPGLVPPENAGLAHVMPARQRLTMQGHFINSTDAPLLREVWLNFQFVPAEEVLEVAAPFRFFAGVNLSIPPRTRQAVSGTCAPPPGVEALRVLDLFGHVHAHGRRVSAWHVEGGAAGAEPRRTLVYETYDWKELERYSFNSVAVNPPATYAGGRGGAASGVLRLGPGDTLELECDFDNTTDVTLRFGATAFTSEMCALIGTYAPSLGGEWHCQTE
jgi:hypothetical protein